MAQEVPLYEQVAARIERLIDRGTLRPGQRIPSVRRLREQWSVSVSTVLEAYRLLEDRGRIEARPQSGHYVRALPRSPEPRPARTAVKPRAVEVASLGLRVMNASDEPGVVSFGAALPDVSFLPTKALGRIMADVARRAPGSHGHANALGVRELRRVLARRMVDAGCSLAPDDIVITNGAQEALYLALRAVTKPGDVVAVESPSYFGTLNALEALGLKALEVRTSPQDGLDVAHLAECLERFRVAACVVCPPCGNPLGSRMPDDACRELARLAARAQLPVLEDDVFGELSFDGVRTRAVKAYDEDGWVLYLSSVSKVLSSGLRIGWMTPGRFASRVAELKVITSLTTATVPQLTVAEYYSSGGIDRHVRRLRRAFADNVERTRAFVDARFPPGTRVSRPRGGLFLWVELPSAVDAELLFERAVERDITLAPGTLFSPADCYRSCLRLSCGLPWDARVEAALGEIADLASEQLAEAGA